MHGNRQRWAPYGPGGIGTGQVRGQTVASESILRAHPGPGQIGRKADSGEPGKIINRFNSGLGWPVSWSGSLFHVSAIRHPPSSTHLRPFSSLLGTTLHLVLAKMGLQTLRCPLGGHIRTYGPAAVYPPSIPDAFPLGAARQRLLRDRLSGCRLLLVRASLTCLCQGLVSRPPRANMGRRDGKTMVCLWTIYPSST